MSSRVHSFINYPMNQLPNELIYVSRLIFHVSIMRYSLSELVLPPIILTYYTSTLPRTEQKFDFLLYSSYNIDFELHP